MPAAEQREWEAYGHMRVEPAFQDRVFVMYQACGKDQRDEPKPPIVITTIRVLSFVAKDDFGCVVRVLNDATGKEMEISHVPTKLFGYPIFICVPPAFTLRYDARQHAGKVLRSLSYLLLVKARNKADFYSQNNYYVETPNRMRALFPNVDLKLDL